MSAGSRKYPQHRGFSYVQPEKRSHLNFLLVLAFIVIAGLIIGALSA